MLSAMTDTQINSYSDLSPCGHPAITDKIWIPICRGLTQNDYRYYGISLFRTHNDVLKVSAISRVDCICLFFHFSLTTLLQFGVCREPFIQTSHPAISLLKNLVRIIPLHQSRIFTIFRLHPVNALPPNLLT